MPARTNHALIRSLTRFAMFVAVLLGVLGLALFSGSRAAFAAGPDAGGVGEAGLPTPSDAGAPGIAPTSAEAGAAQSQPQVATAQPQPQASPLDEIRIPPTEAERAEGQPIVRIDITGAKRVARDDILTYMREHPKSIFKVEGLSSDVRALWDSGFFDDISVDLSVVDAGVVLRFIVHERPNIKAVEFEGNEELENDKLTEAVEVKPNTILSVPSIRRSVQKIKDAYAEKGYFLADVEAKQENQRDNEVIIKFKITEHQPVTVRRITFIGNYSVPDSELRDGMQTGQSSFFSFGSGGPYKQDIFERDVLLLNALYYDKG